MVSRGPGINRFVAGRRIYARNSIEVVLTVRRSMSTTSNETTIKAVFAPTDTIFDVHRQLNAKIDEINDKLWKHKAVMDTHDERIKQLEHDRERNDT